MAAGLGRSAVEDDIDELGRTGDTTIFSRRRFRVRLARFAGAFLIGPRLDCPWFAVDSCRFWPRTGVSEPRPCGLGPFVAGLKPPKFKIRQSAQPAGEAEHRVLSEVPVALAPALEAVSPLVHEADVARHALRLAAPSTLDLAHEIGLADERPGERDEVRVPMAMTDSITSVVRRPATRMILHKILAPSAWTASVSRRRRGTWSSSWTPVIPATTFRSDTRRSGR